MYANGLGVTAEGLDVFILSTSGAYCRRLTSDSLCCGRKNVGEWMSGDFSQGGCDCIA